MTKRHELQFRKDAIMARKYYSDKMSQPKNNRANMPENFFTSDYPDLPCGDAVGYADTRMDMDDQMRRDQSVINNKNRSAGNR